MSKMIVNSESITAIANAIRAKGSITGTLTFPDDFVTAIENLQSVPDTETLALSLYYGYQFSSSIDDYIAVGANSSHTNDDAVWSFTPSINATSATFHFTWNNASDGNNNGWASAYDYAFAISTDNSRGMIAYTASGKEVVNLSGSSGTATVTFSGLSLVAGTTYCIRANFNGTAMSNMKAFAKNGNTVQITT